MNLSDRFLGIMAETRPPGNDPHKVAEALRHFGAIPEEVLPFSDDLQNVEEYYSFKNANETDCKKKGEDFLFTYDVGHEWLWTSYPGKTRMLEILREYLQYSPVCVSVSAWSSDANDLYYSNFPNNHWVMCYGIEGDSLLIFDSYGQDKKKLHPDHQIMMAKRYFIGPSTRQEKLTWIEMMLNWIQEQINLLKKKI